MPRTRKTPADLLADLAADHPWDSDEYRALVAAGLRPEPAPLQYPQPTSLGAVRPPAKHAPAVPAMLDAEGGTR